MEQRETKQSSYMTKTTTNSCIREAYSAPECAVVSSLAAELICTSPFGTDPIGEDSEYLIF